MTKLNMVIIEKDFDTVSGKLFQLFNQVDFTILSEGNDSKLDFYIKQAKEKYPDKDIMSALIINVILSFYKKEFSTDKVFIDYKVKDAPGIIAVSLVKSE